MFDAFRLVAERIGNQRYLVKRGVINYAALDWTKYPRTFALMMDEGSLFNSSEIGADWGQVTLEVFAKLPGYRDDPMVDDGLMEELISDVKQVIEAVLLMKNAQGDPIILNLPRQTARFSEAHDLHLGVQGIVATFELSY